MHRLKVHEHHSKFNDSEIVRVDMKLSDTRTVSVVIQHLGSQNSIILEVVYDGFDRVRVDDYVVQEIANA